MPSGQAAHLESRAPTWDMLLSTPHPFPGRRKGLASRTPCLGEPGPADTQVALRLQSKANGVRPSQLAIKGDSSNSALLSHLGLLRLQINAISTDR